MLRMATNMEEDLGNQVRRPMDAILTHLARVADHHHIGDKDVLFAQMEVKPVWDGSAGLPA